MRIIGGKALIVEDGKPSFVIIDVDEYLQFDSVKKSMESEAETIEKINKDIAAWKDGQDKDEIRQIDPEFAPSKSKDSGIEIVEDDTNL